MRILVGNNQLIQTGGTESYTFALAISLKKIGHEVEYFTFARGFVSEQLETCGIPFMSHDYYDLILANHTPVVEHLFCYGFIIQTCHGIILDLEQPSPFADMYVCISEEIKNHLQNIGIKSDVMLNGIDCNRFTPYNPIHSNLTCVLSLCQSDIANNFIKECCDSISDGNIEFISCNKFTDNVWEIEKRINQADLVVGIGRSLYDAMACGRCVISYDYRPYHSIAVGDGYLSKNNIQQSIAYNCSGRGLNKTFTKAEFILELKKYNPEDGRWARCYALENLNIEKSAKRYLEYYDNNKDKVSGIERQKLIKVRTLHTMKETEMNNRITILEEKLLQISKKRNKYLKTIRAIVYIVPSFIVIIIVIFFILFS
ncbi:MAG: hypothetical protein J1E37_05865 [Prevotella sp.]|nr:hypothetical protein [Prevotella sp.]